MSKVLDAFCEYISWNWNASLGYSDKMDKEVLKNVCDDYQWLLSALAMTQEDFIEYYESRFN